MKFRFRSYAPITFAFIVGGVARWLDLQLELDRAVSGATRVIFGILGLTGIYHLHRIYDALNSPIMEQFKASMNHRNFNNRIVEGLTASLVLWALGVTDFTSLKVPSPIVAGTAIWMTTRCWITFREVKFLAKASQIDASLH